MSEPVGSPAPHHDAVKIGIVSISDRASSGVYEDKGLPALQDWLTRALHNPIAFESRLIPDEQDGISAALVEMLGKSMLTNRASEAEKLMRQAANIVSDQLRDHKPFDPDEVRALGEVAAWLDKAQKSTAWSKWISETVPPPAPSRK